MAKNKVTHSPQRRKKPAYPEVKGKIVDRVEITFDESTCAIGIMFQDRTYLSFDIEPSLLVRPELSDWKTGNYRPLKRWRTLQS